MKGLAAALFVLFAAACVASLTFLLLHRRPSSYEGRVVDKSVTLVETQRGSRRALRLHLKGRGGETISVGVNDDTYARAQVGMWARDVGKGVELSWDEPTPAGAAKSEGAETPSVSAPSR